MLLSAILSKWSYNYFMVLYTLPESDQMDTRDFVGFLLFQAVWHRHCHFLGSEHGIYNEASL
jgi:hypothetical protein